MDIKEIVKKDLYSKQFKVDQQQLQEDIDYINEILNTFLDDIKKKEPSEAVDIEYMLKKIQRIKRSNNIIFIKSLIDDLVRNILHFFDRNEDLENIHFEAVGKLRTLLSSPVNAEISKKAEKVKAFLDKVFWGFIKTFQHPHSKESESQQILKNLKRERNRMAKLLLIHGFFSYFSKNKEQRIRHKSVFLKLWMKFKKKNKFISDSIHSINKAYELKKFSFKFIIDEIEYFFTWLFIVYIMFFAISEIAIIKSKLISSHLVWNLVKSDLIIWIVLFVFLVVGCSTFIKKYFSRSIPLIFLSYFCILMLSFLYYVNI